jgi:sugar O-acyltransferase (sialic acid O-acetyltransferase NeuD family)
MLPIVIIGGGGHASVLADILLSQGCKIAAYISPEPALNQKIFAGISHLLEDDEINTYHQDSVLLVNGIGHLPKQKLRHSLYKKFTALGYRFVGVRSEKATISEYAEVSESAQILHCAIVQAGVKIGENTIINTGSIIEHDTELGNAVHVAPNATICGGSYIDDGSFVGASATVIQGVKIGKNSTVGAGTTVLKSFQANSLITGSGK